MRTARWIFWAAGAYGLVVLAPQYFLFEIIGRDQRPPITHPEYFFGFIGVALVWQVAFFLIGCDPPRYRPMMLVSGLEKISFAIATAILFAQQQVAMSIFVFGVIDLSLAGLFLVAWHVTAGSENADNSIAER